jgi:hypothetical protein
MNTPAEIEKRTKQVEARVAQDQADFVGRYYYTVCALYTECALYRYIWLIIEGQRPVCERMPRDS